MKFAIVQPRERKVDVVNVPDTSDAKALAGLPLDETDHGTIYLGLGYICHEHAMFDHPQFYFAIGRTLMAGNVVLYACDSVGRTVDFNLPPYLWGGTWVGDEAAAEAMIKADKIDRPRMTTPDEVFWQWPAPKPDMAAWSRKVAALMQQGPVQIDDTIIMEIPKDKK